MVENAIIGKVILDFDFANERGYSNFCDLLEEEHQEEFLNILNEVFDANPITRSIQLDTLTIDVGQINSNDFDGFFDTLRRELKDQIDSYHNNSFNTTTGSFSETLLFYVQNGYLPWWASSVESIRPKEGLTSNDLDLLIKNASKLLESKNKFLRLYNAINAAEMDSFVQRYIKTDYDLFLALMQLFGKVIENNSNYFKESKANLLKELSYEFLTLKTEANKGSIQVFEVLLQKLSVKTSLAQQELMFIVSKHLTSGDSVEQALRMEIPQLEAGSTFITDKPSVFDKVLSYLAPASAQSIGLFELDENLMKEFQKFIRQNPQKIVKSIKESKFLQSEDNLENLLFVMGDSVSAIYESFLEPRWVKNYEEVLALFSTSFLNNVFGQVGEAKIIRREVQKLMFKKVFEEDKLQFKEDFKKMLQIVSKVSSVSMSELILIFQNNRIISEASAELKDAIAKLVEEEKDINAANWKQIRADLIASLERNLSALLGNNRIADKVIKQSIRNAIDQFHLDSFEEFEKFDVLLESNFEALGKHFKLRAKDLKVLLRNQLKSGKSDSNDLLLLRYLRESDSVAATESMAIKYDLSEVLWYFDQLESQVKALRKALTESNKAKNRKQRDSLSEIDSVVLSLRYLNDHAVKILSTEQLKTASRTRNQTSVADVEMGLLYQEIRRKSQGLLTLLAELRSFKETSAIDVSSKTAPIGGGLEGETTSFVEIDETYAFKKIKWSLVESAQALTQLKTEADRLEPMLLKGSNLNSEKEDELFLQIQKLILQSLSLKAALEEDVQKNVKNQSAQKQTLEAAALTTEAQRLYEDLIMKAIGLANRLQSWEVYTKSKGNIELGLKEGATNIRMNNLKSVVEFNRLVSKVDLATGLKNMVSKIAKSDSSSRKQSKKDDKEILTPKSIRTFDQLDHLLSLTTNVAYDWVTNFDDLVSDPNLMLQFLSDHKGNKEALLLFSDLSIDELHTDAIKAIFNQIDDCLILIEEFLLEIQSKYIIATLNTANFRRIIRLLLVEFLSENTVFKTIDAEEFGFKVMTYFASNKRLDYKQVQLFSTLNSSSTNPLENNILEGINVFLERFLFQSVNTAVQNEIHYKDIVYYYLLNGQLPEWSNISGITLSDAINYLEVRITKGDADFVKLVFNNKSILDKITDRFSGRSKDLHYQLLELLQAKGNTFQLGNFYTAFLEFFGASNVSKKSVNSTYLFQFIMDNMLWRASSPLSYFQLDFFDSQEEFNRFLSHFKVQKWPAQDQLKKATEAEHQILINLYVESFGLKGLEVLWNENSIEQLKTHISKNPGAMKALLLNVTEPAVINDRLIELVPSQQVLFNQLSELISHPSPFTTGLHQIIFDSIASVSFSTQAAVDLTKLIYTVLAKGENDDKTFLLFLDKLALVNPQLFMAVLTSIKNVQANLKHPLIHEFFEKDADRLNSLKPIRPLEMSKKQDWENIQYFLTFESLNYQEKEIEANNISNILMRMLAQDAVRLRKLFYAAGKSSGKLKKIIGLLKTDQADKLIDLIHDQFNDFIEEANALLNRHYKTSIKKAFGLKTKRQEIVFYFEFWSANSEVFIDGIKFLEVVLFKTLDVLKMRSLDFVQLVEQGEARLSRTQQLVVDAMNKTLKAKTAIVEQTRPKESSASLEALGLLDEDSIYIRNAGLVIAWPYLNTLFDKCGYLEGNKFKDIESRDRAVMLSQYLVVGTDAILEEDLPLNKLLLGIPLIEFVDTSLSLTDFEKSMTESLLQGIIANWTTLGNTSIQGLRETFLNREGALVKKEMDYKLKVKTETFDVLIPTIPWNISMIQTSFMNFRLLVEWK
jgi:hypothetical protein